MRNATEIPLDDGNSLVDPPMVDLLYLNGDSKSYVITFIPEDSVSRNEKEIVVIPAGSEDGRRIALRLREIGKVLGGQIGRLFHAGGGDFGFDLRDGRVRHLSDASGSGAASQQIYVQLQDLGMTAQSAFLQRQLSGKQSGQPIRKKA